MEKAIKHAAANSTPENDSLVKQLFDAINPDSNKIAAGALRTLLVNLDSDAGSEALILATHVSGSATLVVAKQKAQRWEILYTEDFETFYSDPDLNVANIQSANKTFFIRQMYTRGTGIYLDTYRFYKLVDSKVLLVLEIPNRSHLFGWGTPLNQEMYSKFTFSSASDDELFVTYNYSFFAGPIFERDLSWESHEEIALIKDSKGVDYLYDTTSNTYVPAHYESGLSDEQIDCFTNLGNDSLFYHAFADELQNNLTEDNSAVALFTKSFIKYMEGDSSALHSQPIKKLGSTGTLDFYGPGDND